VSFQFTELQEGEKIVFGPITTTRSTSVSGSSSTGQGSVSHSSGRTVGVTTERVIVEDLGSADKTQIILNSAVQQVAIKRQQRNNQSTLTLASVKTAAGPSVKLDIKGLPAQAENLLQETFPNAEVAESKGGSKVLLIVAIVIAAIILLACVVPMLIPLILRIFGG